METVTCLKIGNKLVDFLGISSVTWTINDSIDYAFRYSYIKYQGKEYTFSYHFMTDDKFKYLNDTEDGISENTITRYYEDNPDLVYEKYNLYSKSIITCNGEEIETIIEYKNVRTDVDTEGMIEALRDTMTANVIKYNEDIMLARHEYLLTLPNLTIQGN